MALFSTTKLPGIVVVVGGMLFGTPFLKMIQTFFTHGIPKIWNDVIEPSACYRGLRSGTWFAIVLPIIGLVLGLGTARFSIGMGQILIYIGFVLSYIVLGTLLFLVDAAAAVMIAVLPETERTEKALSETRQGFKRYVQTILAFELFAALSFVVLGVYAALFVVAGVILALAAYYQVAAAYDVPVTWAPAFMMNTSIAAVFVMVILVTLSVLPVTRPHMLAAGIDPTIFLHGGVIRSNNVDAAERARIRKEREICKAEMNTLVDAMAAIDASRATARDALANITRQLAEKKRTCTF